MDSFGLAASEPLYAFLNGQRVALGASDSAVQDVAQAVADSAEWKQVMADNGLSLGDKGPWSTDDSWFMFEAAASKNFLGGADASAPHGGRSAAPRSTPPPLGAGA